MSSIWVGALRGCHTFKFASCKHRSCCHLKSYAYMSELITKDAILIIVIDPFWALPFVAIAITNFNALICIYWLVYNKIRD